MKDNIGIEVEKQEPMTSEFVIIDTGKDSIKIEEPTSRKQISKETEAKNRATIERLLKSIDFEELINHQAKDSVSSLIQNYDLVKEVGMSKYDFATEEKPILATWGLATCTGILAYDLEKKFAFLSHSDPMLSYLYTGEDSLGKPSISAHVRNLVNKIDEGDESYKLSFIIYKGDFPEKNAIKTIRENIESIKSPNIEVVSLLEKEAFEGGSIAFDSRNGRKTMYNPKENPYHVENPDVKNIYGTYDGKGK